jgi:uridine phosphorylase
MLRLKDAGVSNIEMESTAFTALTHKAGFKSAVVCVTLLDRLNEDQVIQEKTILYSLCYILFGL